MSTSDHAPADALAAQLERLYYVERELRTELETLANDVAIDTLDDARVTECRDELRARIDEHREETDRHRERVEEAFDVLGEEPSTRRAPELDGLLADKEAFNNVVLNDELRPLYYLEVALKLEAIECTAYETAMAIAGALGDEGDAVIDALQDSYDEERAMRTDLESLADGDAIETLLAATTVDENADRSSLDRSW
ncbi:ferritin-like domain-containing protein [Halosolutus gelatinilyticus]|uniref:YciE/YciF ferroxidase family protein n=1 Tax=Halosolutus gelatinilyticus TaxID=2931975 RepID=UPI001FF415B7|nr:DUF892 family protein [Halosolutus gelatinilyticus]